MIDDYKYDVQELFLRILVHDPQLFNRVQNIFNPKNFDNDLVDIAKLIQEHAAEYSSVPTVDQIAAITGHKFEHLDKSIVEEYGGWFLTEFERFTRKVELERAILHSAKLIDNGDFGPVEKLVKDAVQISLMKDLGTDYFQDPKTRLERIKENNGTIKTGFPQLDHLLYGGFNRGSLNILAGGSGSGKSLMMQNFAVNWAEAKMNGLFITLELSEDLCAMRLDAMVTQTHSRRIFKEIDNVSLTVSTKAKTMGKLQIKYLPAQSTVNDVRAFVNEYQIRTGIKIDYICLDYLDLVMPDSVKVNPSDVFTKDKYVSEELRNLAKELDVVLLTASQLNRSSVDEPNFNHSHISGGISKINTADNVIGIYTSAQLREQRKYQLQLMKTRSSAGVGQSIDLEFDDQTLRIVDTGAPGQSPSFNQPVPQSAPQPQPQSSLKEEQMAELLRSIKNR